MLFPKRGESTPPHEVARASGELTVDDASCLRVAEAEVGPAELAESEGDNLVPVWPPEYELSMRDDVTVVLNGAGEEAAVVGEEVEIEGAKYRSGLRRVPDIERVLRELRVTCPEPYFIVDIAAKDIERDPERRKRIQENNAKAQYRGG